MDTKKMLGTVLTILGIVGLIAGVLGIFEGNQIAGLSSWAFAILGLVFFSAGIGLMKTVKTTNT